MSKQSQWLGGLDDHVREVSAQAQHKTNQQMGRQSKAGDHSSLLVGGQMSVPSVLSTDRRRNSQARWRVKIRDINSRSSIGAAER